ncbi:23S rRNA (pseudouridine(1915)-N(3))-methyltransferase RlmH [Hyphomicrobium sp.]|uniref:23S rRNA (pseudouridine(1915)-N(3))-methyltransferase RlmH n=1 Tax=Hyphomicrobium sp. TaxID=82 RepID=UPI0025BA0319|nr:23S rRNA (pseudouridine(1915)-N(3))-methyltransferase RlmH [Hyphomicrobium sp.]MCC7252858.1 23S rRNA (pseudouridine(1915)-N(3))-methyltransferase RlmH [Hyphomicrobium sp.]
MRLSIVAVGRLKDGPERELYLKYAKRIDDTGRNVALGPVKLTEIAEARQASAAQRRADEAQRLAVAADADFVVLLDEGGTALGSEAFARLLATRRDEGRRTTAFLIGGPDGHGGAARAKAQLVLSLGPMTLPHGLARIVLAEQIYRAATILSGHPYHRA